MAILWRRPASHRARQHEDHRGASARDIASLERFVFGVRAGTWSLCRPCARSLATRQSASGEPRCVRTGELVSRRTLHRRGRHSSQRRRLVPQRRGRSDSRNHAKSPSRALRRGRASAHAGAGGRHVRCAAVDRCQGSRGPSHPGATCALLGANALHRKPRPRPCRPQTRSSVSRERAHQNAPTKTAWAAVHRPERLSAWNESTTRSEASTASWRNRRSTARA